MNNDRNYVRIAAGAVITGFLVGLVVGLLVALFSMLIPGLSLNAVGIGLIAGVLAAILYLADKLGFTP